MQPRTGFHVASVHSIFELSLMFGHLSVASLAWQVGQIRGYPKGTLCGSPFVSDALLGLRDMLVEFAPVGKNPLFEQSWGFDANAFLIDRVVVSLLSRNRLTARDTLAGSPIPRHWDTHWFDTLVLERTSQASPCLRGSFFASRFRPTASIPRAAAPRRKSCRAWRSSTRRTAPPLRFPRWRAFESPANRFTKA